MIYVLKSPGGWLIEETATTDSREAWTRSFNYLCSIDHYWHRYWKRWDASRAAARRHGWYVVKAKLKELE